MLFRKTDEIDQLEKKQNKLISKKENKTSRVNCKNTRIYAKIKRMEEKMYDNRINLDRHNEKIDLELEKNSKLIIASAEYAKKLSSKYTSTNRETKAIDLHAEYEEKVNDSKTRVSSIVKSKKTK